MEYQKQLDKFESYFKSSEKELGTEGLGLEVEHFVVDKQTLETISYSDESGIEQILYQIVQRGWEGKKEGDALIQASRKDAVITLEPGGQLEISIAPQCKIAELENKYFDFLSDLIPILDENNQLLVAAGYQIENAIAEIDWNPKQRYKIMSNYLAEKGKYAHNMMKGSASIQIAADYINEEDFVKKFRIANALAPAIAALFDNAAYFEGAEYVEHNIRTDIWSNCDPDRAGTIKEAFDKDFGYRKYAEYILSRPPILLKTGDGFISTGDKTCREVFTTKELGQEELEHVLTMFFPDVRAKNFIEIRMMDSLSPELTFAAVAFWKGLLYDSENLEEVYKIVNQLTYEEVLAAREDVVKRGLEAEIGDYQVLELGKELVEISKTGLSAAEKEYLTPFEELLTEGKNPVAITREKLRDGYSKREALDWLILNSRIDNKEE
ncbi:glutamate--cysteine ligase [Selenihalanaerobacter shriftii]|uniref:Glutamate--cysteine ligase n=1 Tax=Selenihalanaerobacter shriftii TaxID=142842 RepID=A0A1T4K644_9FIRM|nr:glutamate-cysteine ligase family protein [Selenihalanaerobacter shriftii]SJZ37904.1 glutamate--cysteine ligase [Selenihalanaerobacter shriftii]